ncbi:uncharacterized protein LOC114977128 [Acropora millepora]|uniref:uncharacterized protein LOC114977128 n=1 Tax=Acropora millepora TaxID=45264 RepID=UPI001CF3143B|nr:uncharacterized protein LOC114977128 [Acropora millepora]
MKLVSGAVVEGISEFRIPIRDWKFKVSHYSVDFSPDGRLWRAVTDEDGYYRHFQVEREHRSQRKNYYKTKARYQSFNPALHARLVRIRIEAWRGIPCMSLYLYGCDSHWAMENKQLTFPPKPIDIGKYKMHLFVRLFCSCMNP